MAKSIMQDTKECYVTGATDRLQKHHIYPGTANRKISEQNGFWVWLRYDYHVGTPYAVHNNTDFKLKLQRECQKKFEQTHSREEFMALIGRNYL